MAKAVTKDQLSDCLDRIAEYFDKDFDGATSSTAGEKGMVPTPTAGDNNKFLRGDGTWSNPTLAEIIVSATQPSSTNAIWIKPST
jgi:hypothetical protein